MIARAYLLGAVLMASVSLAACGTDGSRSGASARYGAPGQNAAERDQAYRACKTYAEDEVLRAEGFDTPGFNAMSSADPRAQMRAYDNKRAYSRMVNACMANRGFARRSSDGTALDDSVESLRENLRW